jgi:hypothetical protein
MKVLLVLTLGAVQILQPWDRHDSFAWRVGHRAVEVG